MTEPDASLTSELGDAAILRRQGLAADSNGGAAHRTCGDALKRVGRYEEALASYERALGIDPNDVEGHIGRGSVLRALMRFDEALASFERAIALRAGDAEIHFHRAVVLQFLGRLDEALSGYERALRISPGLAEAHYNRGIALQDLRRFEAALASYTQAIDVMPSYADAYINRANLLSRLGRLDEAHDDLVRARAVKPDSPELQINLGNVLRRLGRFYEALDRCERAVAIQPKSAEAHLNLGAVLYDLNQPEAAVACYDRALALRPDFAGAHQNRAYALLMAGNFARGWAEHEWRWRNDQDPLWNERARFAQPPWLGGESLAGKRVLLHAEQGFGDVIQFCRFARWVADLGATVMLEVPRPLATLVADLDGVSQVIVCGEPLPTFDAHCPLMSLPLAFHTELSTVPARVPYLKADPAKVRHWKERLGPARRTRVGLVWSGGFRPEQPDLWTLNLRRNIPLAKFAGLRVCDVEFFGLQKGQEARSELADLIAARWDGPTIVDVGEELDDFSDTAALMENLHLVISVDTSAAHLAGALGRPVWLLNRFDSCWRWLLERTDSPWYPTLTIYRQASAGDWDGAMERVREDLCRRVQALRFQPVGGEDPVSGCCGSRA